MDKPPAFIHLNAIHRHLIYMEREATRTCEQLAALVAAGTYPSEPAEEWASLPSGTQVLRLRFPRRRHADGYASPSGRRRLYVGADPEAIRRALATVERTRRRAVLQRCAAAQQARLDEWAARLAPLAAEALVP